VDVLVAGGLAFLLDQCTKGVARRRARGRTATWGSLVRIRYVENPRARGRRAAAPLIWCVALVSAIVACLYEPAQHQGAARIGFALALGGAAGNALDLLRWRAIVDFIDLGSWPVFNLADVAIIAGLAVAVCS
jgi:signal peptidase II